MNPLESQAPKENAWVYLGLGSNLLNPPSQLREGLKCIEAEFVPEKLEVSSIVKTPPLGGKDQPDYYNLACRFECNLAPLTILKTIQNIEDQRGRTREEHWGSRTLDIDVLLIDDLVLDLPELTIPHPGASKRSFVLAPLLDLAPDLVDPKVGITYRQMWDQLPTKDKSSLVTLK